VIGFAVTVTAGETGHDGLGAVTETLCVAGAPEPEQSRVYVVAPEGCTTSVYVPSVADFAPDHPPDAVHEVALVTVQERVVPAEQLYGFGETERFRTTSDAFFVHDVVKVALPPATKFTEPVGLTLPV